MYHSVRTSLAWQSHRFPPCLRRKGERKGQEEEERKRKGQEEGEMGFTLYP